MHFGHHHDNWSLMLSVTGAHATELLWILFVQPKFAGMA